MFPLHDSTRRRIGIAGFLFLCLAPTILVAGWCVARHLPGHAAREADRLGRLLGFEVALGGLRHPRPGVVLYEGLELADPETGRPVLRCRLLEAGWVQRDAAQGRQQPLLVLIASQPEVEAAALDRLGQVLHRVLQRQSGPAQADVRLVAREVTLRADENSQTLTDVQGGVETSSARAQAEARFRLAGVETFGPIRIRIVRDRQATPPAAGFELDTGGAEVPCGLLAMGLPVLEPLGPQGRFRGYVWASRTAEGWSGEVTGQLLDVDLGRLVTDHFPHRLSGTGQVTIHSARFHRGRLEEGSGTLVVGRGVISRSLLDAAVEQLGLDAGAEPKASGDLVPYEQLALAFLINSSGLELQGRCSAAGFGAILVDRYRRLLSEPAVQLQPVVALLRTLVPASEVQVPATRQTDWLMRRLPVPQVVAPRQSEPLMPQARVRLGRAAVK
jgi:hypothetical protein